MVGARAPKVLILIKTIFSLQSKKCTVNVFAVEVKKLVKIGFQRGPCRHSLSDKCKTCEVSEGVSGDVDVNAEPVWATCKKVVAFKRSIDIS